MSDATVGPFEDPYEHAVCPLPGCGADLYLTATIAFPVYLSSTAADLADISKHVSSGWQIDCTEGHTILVPPPTAEDDYEFGRCKCEPTDPTEDAYCGHGDLDRLRAVLALSASAVSS